MRHCDSAGQGVEHGAHVPALDINGVASSQLNETAQPTHIRLALMPPSLCAFLPPSRLRHPPHDSHSSKVLPFACCLPSPGSSSSLLPAVPPQPPAPCVP